MGLVHARAMLGGIAQAEHRLDDAAHALERAAEESAAMGFLGQAGLHRATLARVQQRAGDLRAAASYEQAIRESMASGDGRLAATGRLNLAAFAGLPATPPRRSPCCKRTSGGTHRPEVATSRS